MGRPGRSKMLHRVQVPPPILAAELVVTQQHSYELVKTVVTAALSQIVLYRRVFPDLKPDMCVYDPTDPEMDYEAFMKSHTTRQSSHSNETGEKMFWPILPRSTTNKHVKKFFDCLETGVADALKKECLAQITLSFHCRDESPVLEDNLVESYSIFFKDAGAEHDPVVASNAKQELYQLVQKVWYETRNHDLHMKENNLKFPAAIRMSIALRFNERVKEGYLPPGSLFRRGDEDTDRILNVNIPDEQRSMNTGFTCVSIGMCLDRLPSQQLPSVVPQSEELALSPRLEIETLQETHETQLEAVRAFKSIGAHRVLETQDTLLATPRASSSSNYDSRANMDSTTPSIDGTIQDTPSQVSRFPNGDILRGYESSGKKRRAEDSSNDRRKRTPLPLSSSSLLRSPWMLDN